MSVQACTQCDGNGYHYNKKLGEITGFCPACEGTGFVESSDFTLHDPESFSVQIQLSVATNTRFPEEVVQAVNETSFEGLPWQSDYILQLIMWMFSKQEGIQVNSLGVGRMTEHSQVVDTREAQVLVMPEQPTLFDIDPWTPNEDGTITCVDCLDEFEVADILGDKRYSDPRCEDCYDNHKHS